MVKRLLTMLMLGGALSASAQYQLPNNIGTFDGEWVDCYPWEKGDYVSKAYGSQPEGWCISNVPNSMVKDEIGSQEDGYSGDDYAVKITNVAAAGNGIPGYMTLGTSWATAETRLTSTRNKDGGVFGGITFTYRPDAISLMYQRDGGDSETDISTVVAYSWKGTWTQKDVPSNTAVGVVGWGSAVKVTMTDRDVNIMGLTYSQGGEVTKTPDAQLVAKVIKKITGTTEDWTKLEIPLEYETTSVVPEKFNIVISAAGYQDDGGTITEGVSMTVDDVKLVYWNTLESLIYNGKNLLSGTKTSYTVDDVHDPSKLEAVAKSQFGIVTTSYNETNYKVTVKVQREGATTKTYTIQFNEPIAPEPEGIDYPYSEPLYISINGGFAEPQVADVVVRAYEDTSFDFILKNFVLGSDMPVGNINVKGLNANGNGEFSFAGNIKISAGDKEGIAPGAWQGPGLGDIPLDLSGMFVDDKIFVDINIDMMSSIGQIITVHLGDDYVPATMTVTDAQYGTFCAPFEVVVPEGVEASTATLDGEVVVLTSVGNTIPANTPVILYAEEDLFAEEDLYATTLYGKPVEGTPVAGVLTGVYELTVVPANSYLLQNHEGKVGFYNVGEETLHVGANRCYLTVTDPDSAVKAYFFNEEADAINAVMAENDKEMFDLQGRKVMNAQKGIFIQNGKKVVK